MGMSGALSYGMLCSKRNDVELAEPHGVGMGEKKGREGKGILGDAIS